MTNNIEIALNPSLTDLIKKVFAETTALQEQIKAKTESLQSLVLGICLNSGMDTTTDKVSFSEDFTILYITKPEEQEAPPKKESKSKK